LETSWVCTPQHTGHRNQGLQNHSKEKNPMLYLPFLIFIGVIILIILFAIIANTKHAKAIEALSQQLRMEYTNSPSPTELSAYTSLDLFNKGNRKSMHNLMRRSENNLRTSYFEYQYSTGKEKNRTIHSLSVTAIYNPTVLFPQFAMKPENLFHRIADKFTGKDIDFETHPEFSKMFVLRGEDETQIRRLFSVPALQHLEQCKGLCIEAHTHQIIFYKQNKSCSAKKIEQFIRDSLETYAVLCPK
jgi:hypothetical protein